jgi:hypothetical protein
MTNPFRPAFPIAFVATALACREPAATPSTQPLTEFRYATARPDCAPWDGPAVGITLTTTADTVDAAAPPYIYVGLYDTRERLLGRTLRWPAAPQSGGASWCAVDGTCAPADSGVVTLEALEGDSVLVGRLRLVFAGRPALDGAFRAAWRPRLAMCG